MSNCCVQAWLWPGLCLWERQRGLCLCEEWPWCVFLASPQAKPMSSFYIPSKNMETGEIYGVLVYIIDGIFWLAVADRCWIPDKDWQQKCPFEGAVRAAMDYLIFSLHGKSALPGVPTTTRLTNLSSCWAFEYSGMSLTHTRPVFSCFLVLKLCCSSPDCVLNLFERCWTEWSHLVLSLPHFYCCLEQKTTSVRCEKGM